MPLPDRQRALALEIVSKLRAAGFEALWAGGCVRDELLGLVPKDYDVATSATPDQIRNLFGRRRTLAIGAAFGVVTVLGGRAAGQIEVATFRTDATYSDGRHPDSVTFTTAEADAARRDFTINGLFYDPIEGNVVDYVGGQEDLRQHVVRAIGDPRERFREDKLRMLRAVRFAAAFGFRIDDETRRAIVQSAGQINDVSAERIGAEIRRMLVDPNRAVAMDLLRETGLLPEVLPEVAVLAPTAWQETLRVLGRLDQPTLPLALAALVLEAGEPEAPSPRPSLRHGGSSTGGRGGEVAATVGRRLRYTNKEGDRAVWLIARLPIVRQAKAAPWPRLQRVLVHDGAAELVALLETIAGPDDPQARFCRERLAWPADRLNPAPLVDGADLIARGLKPGPTFAELLERVRDAQLEGRVTSREEALALVDRLSSK
jgi:poly(A) polymerase